MEIDPLGRQQLRIRELLDQRVAEGEPGRGARIGPDQHVVVDRLAECVQQLLVRQSGNLGDQLMRGLAPDCGRSEHHRPRIG